MQRRARIRRRRLVLGTVVLLVVAGVLVLTLGGGSGPGTDPTTSAPRASTTSLAPRPKPPFAVGTVSYTLTEPAAPGGTPRSLPTTVRYPATGAPGGADQPGGTPLAAGAPYPLVVFSQGFNIDPEAYSLLLDAWAAAGYVVADPAYPFTSPTSPGGPVRTDIVNHPADLSYVITALLGDSATRGDTLSGLVDPGEVGVIGHSDGGDVSLAAASNTCCHDRRIKAAVILSGAQYAGFPGTYTATPAVPLLVVQGTADTDLNPPSCSIQLYDAAAPPKYYLSMLGQDHTSAYLYAGQSLNVVVTVTVAFLDAYLKHSAPQLAAIGADGNVAGVATVTAAASVGPPTGSCPDAPAG